MIYCGNFLIFAYLSSELSEAAVMFDCGFCRVANAGWFEGEGARLAV